MLQNQAVTACLPDIYAACRKATLIDASQAFSHPVSLLVSQDEVQRVVGNDEAVRCLVQENDGQVLIRVITEVTDFYRQLVGCLRVGHSYIKAECVVSPPTISRKVPEGVIYRSLLTGKERACQKKSQYISYRVSFMPDRFFHSLVFGPLARVFLWAVYRHSEVWACCFYYYYCCFSAWARWVVCLCWQLVAVSCSEPVAVLWRSAV